MKEGEKDENSENYELPLGYKNISFKSEFNISSKNLIVDLAPTVHHSDIITKLLSKISIVIFDYKNEESLINQINNYVNQKYLNKEIIVLYDCKDDYIVKTKRKICWYKIFFV